MKYVDHHDVVAQRCIFEERCFYREAPLERHDLGQSLAEGSEGRGALVEDFHGVQHAYRVALLDAALGALFGRCLPRDVEGLL